MGARAGERLPVAVAGLGAGFTDPEDTKNKIMQGLFLNILTWVWTGYGGAEIICQLTDE